MTDRSWYSGKDIVPVARIHWIAAALQVGSAIAFTVLTATTFDDKLPVYAPIPGVRSSAWDVSIEKLCDVPLGWLIASFLWVSFVSHVFLAAQLPLLEIFMRERRNPVRVLESALSTSALIALVSLLAGVMDGWTLFLLIGLRVLMMSFGYLCEPDPVAKRTHHSLLCCLLGWLPAIFLWVTILGTFITAVLRDSAPHWIYAVVFLALSFDALAYLNSLWWIVMNDPSPRADYRNFELHCVILSVTSKQLLAWLVYGGLTRLS